MLIKVSTHYSWERKLSNKNIGTSGSGCKPCRKPTRKTKIAVDQWLKTTQERSLRFRLRDVVGEVPARANEIIDWEPS